MPPKRSKSKSEYTQLELELQAAKDHRAALWQELMQSTPPALRAKLLAHNELNMLIDLLEAPTAAPPELPQDFYFATLCRANLNAGQVRSQ